MPPKRKAPSKDNAATMAGPAKKSKKGAAPAAAKDETNGEAQTTKKATKSRAKKATDDGKSPLVS